MQALLLRSTARVWLTEMLFGLATEVQHLHIEWSYCTSQHCKCFFKIIDCSIFCYILITLGEGQRRGKGLESFDNFGKRGVLREQFCV